MRIHYAPPTMTSTLRPAQPSSARDLERRFATAIPIYKPTLSGRESRRLGLTLENSPSGNVFLVGPEKLQNSLRDDLLCELPYIAFESSNFDSIKSYNTWMLRPDLYCEFIDFEFVLLCQTDAFLTRPLPRTEDWRFDYLGAPWSPPYSLRWVPRKARLQNSRSWLRSRQLAVGNGGLSLRRTNVFAGLPDLPKFSRHPNEDIAISYFHDELGIVLASVETADRYFMETGATRWHPGQPVPNVYGFHGLQRFNPALEDQILAYY